MTCASHIARAEASAHARTAPAQDQGWYLFGITRGGPLDMTQIERAVPVHEVGGPPQLVACGELAAVVRPVPLAEFSTSALTERAADRGWLEAMARTHNEVIAAVHRVQAILPAKFGAVYADVESLRAALEAASEPLQLQLRRLEGTDEWAVHVYTQRSLVEQLAIAGDADIDRLQREIATARPGHAYFLQRKLAEERVAAIDRALGYLAHAAYEQLVTRALAGQITPLARRSGHAPDELEVLRAAFLVPRPDAESFIQEVRALAESREGMDVACSGPWPPYSFAAYAEESS